MRKDYEPVDDLIAGLGESAFVEQHWTARWQGQRPPADVAHIGRREEYRIIKPYLDGLPRGSRILDGGCGMGEWTRFLNGQGFDVVGLDISEYAVRQLHDWFPDSRFLQGDLRHTDFADSSFDAYYSWGAFEHFESGLGECIDEARRIVRPGGWLFVSVPFHNGRLLRLDPKRLECWDEHFDPAEGYRLKQRFYQWRLTQPELRRELELRGFRVREVTPIAKDTGVSRWLEWEVRLFRKGSLPFRVARKAGSMLLRASYVSHMILAAAERR